MCIGLALNFCGMYGDRRREGPPASRARAKVGRLTPTDRYPRDSNPGPFDLKSIILPLSYRPGQVARAGGGKLFLTWGPPVLGNFELGTPNSVHGCNLARPTWCRMN